MSNLKTQLAAAFLLIACFGTAAHGQPVDTLRKIRESGKITVAYRESSIPFSYLDDKAQPIGYAQELCAHVVDAVKQKLGMPDLRVEHQAVTSANRIPLVQNGTVDIECGSTVNNAERQPLVAFSVTTFVVNSRFLARTSDNLRTIADLKGKTVVVTTGANTTKRVRDLSNQMNLGLNVIFGKDFSDSMLLLTSGRASAFFEDDILLTGLAAMQPRPGDLALGTDSFSADPYALMLRRDDPEFKKLVDATIVGIFRSGDIKDIYDRWFLKPIPPKGIALNFPMGTAMAHIIARPTDSFNPDDYR